MVTELSDYVLSPLREGPFTLYRGCGDGLTPILLVVPIGEYPSPNALQRLEHEYALRSELDDDWAARPVKLLRREARPMLVLADPGGEPLERLLGGPMAVTEFLRIAVPLATAVGRLHARRLMHKDLKPANILVDTASDKVWLTGFGIASRLPREHQAPVPPEVITGTLAYMAPEQTGRMNRSINSRSDFYALGIIFYQMLTGMLPFTAADPMEWVHRHIARQPVPPDARIATIPGPLSALVLKLLAKTADDRYQTAKGLAIDLQHCLTEWQATGNIAPFPLGAQDASDRLLIPEKLYGREREIETLLAAFDRVVAQGAPELVLVSGYSGIGKSSVVNELHKALVPPRGLFASGKFDQYKRDIPYATLAQAFQSLVRPLLGQSEAVLEKWRDALSEALGPNGQLIVNLVPQLELVIGKQPPVQDLPPKDAQNRFQMVFRRFLGVFAKPEHPLALFLDDLQWLDMATLNLLEHLATHSELRHLLLIGAYRDNEVGPAHPLLRTLEAIRSAGARVEEIVLAPLGLEDTSRLIADALHCEPERGRPLAQLVQEKTGGNPFFAIQFFTALAEEGLLALDPITMAWQWNMSRIRAKGITDNVVELMAEKVGRLPRPALRVLKVLACMGTVAQAATLSKFSGAPEEEIHAALPEVVSNGLALLRDGAYAFVHDRVREAVYALIPDAERAAIHLRIGRALASQTTPAEFQETIFETVNQLNRGAPLIDSTSERIRVAAFNLTAGKRAKASTAYASALTYFTTGRMLLGPDGWALDYGMKFDLELRCAECEFLTGELAGIEQRLSALLEHAEGLVERAAVTCLQVALYTTLDRFDCAIEVGLAYLRHANVGWSRHPTDEDVRNEFERLQALLARRPLEQTLDLPLLSDTDLRATMDVLSDLMPPLLFTAAELHDLALLRMANISLEYGYCDGSCYAYARLVQVLGARFADYRTAFRFGQLACDLVDRRGLDRFKARVYMCFGSYVICWFQHLATSRVWITRALDAANASSDVTFAIYARKHLTTNLLVSGEPLREVEEAIERGLAFARKAKFGLVIDAFIGQRIMIRSLRGLSRDDVDPRDKGHCQSMFEQHLAQSPHLALPTCWYWIYRLQTCFFAGDYVGGLEAAAQAAAFLWSSRAYLEVAEYHFYAALVRAAACDALPADSRLLHMEALFDHHRQIMAWAENCPANFENRAALVEAEIARVQGRELEAQRLYEKAIVSAREHGFIQNEGVSHELAGRFYAARGFQTIADLYLRHARSCYLRWGAEGKVRQLDRLHPHLAAAEEARPTATIGSPVQHLDVTSVVKSSQAVSSEIILPKLVERLMTIALENAGADRGLLILPTADDYSIQAEARGTGDQVEVALCQNSIAGIACPESLVRYVIRTHESVILDDASRPHLFSEDSYLRSRQGRSILCLPLIKQRELIGLLYLENSLASHVFTPTRISVLELLASQAAISLENARLYADLTQENRERRTAEDAMRVSEARWRSLFENVPVGVALVRPNGRFVEANPTFRKMTGYSEAELQHLTPPDITHEDDRAATEALIAARAAGMSEAPRLEKRYRRKDGGIIWVEVSIFRAPILGSTPLRAAVAVDITERKRTEIALRRSETYLAEAQRLSRTGSFGWKVASGDLFWSAESFDIFGYDTAPTANIAMVLQRIHPEDLAFAQRTLEPACRTGTDFDIEHRLLMPDGAVRYVHIVGRAVRDQMDELEFIGAVMDVTVAKRAEESLHKAQAELAHAARVTTLGELAASIAHEINQPLAAVASNGDACVRWLNRDPPNLDAARQVALNIVQEAHHAGDVIRSLRALAVKSGPHFTKFDLNGAIEEVLALTRGNSQRQSVALHTDLSANIQPVTGDRVQLQQVLLNLITNGIEAMADVTDRPKMLTITSKPVQQDGVLVGVEDIGTGFEPAMADRLFAPFYTTKSNGMGMGLAICRTIIEAHGGQLWAKPNVPQGTIFQFRLATDGREISCSGSVEL